MPYATAEQLATWLGVAAPSDADRLILRAGELIDTYVFNNYDSTNLAHVAAMQDACCSVVEYWIQLGEVDLTGRQSLNQNGVTMNTVQLPPRARNALFRAGLLYRGVPR